MDVLEDAYIGQYALSPLFVYHLCWLQQDVTRLVTFLNRL